MAFLLDTGILLRIIDESDPIHGIVEKAVDELIARQEDLLITTQNVAELWNVATRPVANNGLNLTRGTVSRLFEQTVEPLCTVVTERDTLPAEFIRLLLAYNVIGKQVHDTRLVAMMLTWQIQNLLTLTNATFVASSQRESRS